jgi:hypothetical protein
MVSSGIGEIDSLAGGLPRGRLTEVCGSTSSGRSSMLLAALAAATQRQEVCALVDATDAFDPLSASAAGIDFERLLWVRCGVCNGKRFRREGHDFTNHRKNRQSMQHRGRAALQGRVGHSQSITGFSPGGVSPREEFSRNLLAPEVHQVDQALRVTDLLLQSGGFGLVAIDLADVSVKTARRIPLTSWFRFQRAVENTPTMLLIITPAPCAQTCATLSLKLSAVSSQLSEKDRTPSHARLLKELHIEGELLRSRLQRKPSRSVTAAFISKAVRTG